MREASDRWKHQFLSVSHSRSTDLPAAPGNCGNVLLGVCPKVPDTRACLLFPEGLGIGLMETPGWVLGVWAQLRLSVTCRGA